MKSAPLAGWLAQAGLRNMPLALFVRGDIKRVTQRVCIAVVGTRKASFQGSYLAHPSDVEGRVPNAPYLAGLPDCLALLLPSGAQSFETVFFDNMGNAVPIVSEGASFSSRQKETFRKLTRNRRFYISRVTVVGPDGLTRTLQNPMEVIVK